jgi:multidrug efflux pump subunit AcrA (membrane-fusion protein)
VNILKLITMGLAATAFITMAGCQDEKAKTAGEAGAAGTAASASAPAPTNRINIPEAVRQNLGITFAKVERRRVASTLRVPGRFELLPTARREYRASLAGSVRLLVSQYEKVGKGTPIFRMDSPEWHTLKRELHEAEAGIERATAELAVAQHAKAEAEQVAEATEKRIHALAGAEVRRAELETELATRRAAIPRLGAEIKVKEAALEEAKHDLELNIEKAASVLGLSADFLRETEKGNGGHETQRWYGINQIEIAARDAGMVETIGVTDGAWVAAGDLIATTMDPKAIRFRAVGLQSDMAKLANGLDATVLPPQGAAAGAEPLPGKLQLGPVADPDQRTVDLIVMPEKTADWARPGVSSLLEIVTDGSAEAELSIPVSAVVRDELTQVFFRRDPRDPNKVIRMEADLGVSDGKWVVVKSGVKEGDEVVLHGVYELKLASGTGPTGGGHFHADGTWHAEPDKNEQPQ